MPMGKKVWSCEFRRGMRPIFVARRGQVRLGMHRSEVPNAKPQVERIVLNSASRPVTGRGLPSLTTRCGHPLVEFLPVE